MWTSRECGVFSTNVLISLLETASCFGQTNRCLSLIWSMWSCSSISKWLFYIKRQKTGVLSSVRNHVDTIVITDNHHNLFVLYLQIYHSSRNNKLFFHSLIYYITYYSKVTRRYNYTEVRGENWKTCFFSTCC